MRKYTGLLIFAAAAVITIGSAMTSLAATGWEQVNGTWYYNDSNGNKVGEGWRKIDGKQYRFNSDGSMRYGWFEDDDNIYYLGDQNDGSMKVGWLCLNYNKDDRPQDGEVNSYTSAGGGGTWFYFQSNGKANRAASEEYEEKTIDNKKYCFDEYGAMQTGWIAIEDADSEDGTGISKFKYYGGADDGSLSKGWKYLSEHPADSDDSDEITGDSEERPNEGEGYWYYFKSDGTPAYLPQSADNVSKALTKVNGDYYFFDRYGCMRSGLIGLEGITSETVTLYFGDSDADGKMRTGKQTSVKEENGDTGTFYFNTSGSNKGAGYTGEKDDYLYYNGKLLKAESGEDYQIFEVNDKVYIVSEAGKVQASNKKYKINGEYRFEYDHGTIYEIDDDKDRVGEITSGEEAMPDISYTETYSL